MPSTVNKVVRHVSGGRTYYFGTLSSDKIKGVTFVPTLERSIRQTPLNEQEEEGYQRPGSITRMRMFAKYLANNPNCVVPPVVLSSRDCWEFKTGAVDDDYGTLTINGQAAIIDGQHRVGGYVHHYEENQDARNVAFFVIPGLTLDEEKDEFLAINTTQKGVPKQTTAYLLNEDPAQVAWNLNELDDSPFKGRITRSAMQRHHLFALHSVAKNVTRLFNESPALRELDVDTKTEFMMRFWTIIADEKQNAFYGDLEKLDNPETRGRRDFEFKLLELTGLIAWSHTGSRILHRAYTPEIGMNWDAVRTLIDAADEVDWSKEGTYVGRTGEAGGRVIADDMMNRLPPLLHAVPPAEDDA